jgi:hypothetical protein
MTAAPSVEIFHHSEHSPIVFLHPVRVPLAVFSWQVALRSYFSLETRQQKRFAGVQQIHPELDSLGHRLAARSRRGEIGRRDQLT